MKLYGTGSTQKAALPSDTQSSSPESSRRLGVTRAPGSSPGWQHPSLRAPEVCLHRPSPRLLSPETRLVGVAREGTEIIKMNEPGTEQPLSDLSLLRAGEGTECADKTDLRRREVAGAPIRVDGPGDPGLLPSRKRRGSYSHSKGRD